MEISELFGETTEYDKKQAVEMKKPKSWLKSVSAFANGKGGVLVFGIADDDTIIGIEDIKMASEFVSQKIKERIDPFPEINLRIHRTGDSKNILTVEIMEGRETPYYYRGDGTVEAFVRIGNETVTANSAELKRLVMRGKNSSYDSLMSDYDFHDYSFSKLRERFKEWNGNSMPEKSFESFGIVNDKGKLSNAGVLLADNCPIRHSRIFCTRWNGLDKSGGKIDALDSAEYSGSLIILLNEAFGFVKRNMKVRWKKTANSRIEMPDYCERSIFECVVNALIHRDYLVNGSEVHIDIFHDRLVVYSPGGMPDGTKIQERNIDNIPSTRRNPVLADIFGRLGYMERQGSGLNKIRSAYESAANYRAGMEPEFYSDRVEFMVTLKNLNYKFSSNEAKSEAKNEAKSEAKSEAKNEAKSEAKNEAELTEIEERICKLIKEEPQITQLQLQERLELSRSKVQRVMKKLREKGVIEHIGSKRSGYWNVDM